MPEPRRDPLRGHWSLIAEHRAERPHDVRVEERAGTAETCPFCPGHEHLTPPPVVTAPDHGPWSWRVVPNKYPAVDPERGLHEVLVETPRHEGDVIDAEPGQSAGAWRIAADRLRAMHDAGCGHVLAFKNFGERGGATLRHPHLQLLGQTGIPPGVSAEHERATRAHREHGVCLTCAAGEAGAREITRAGGLVVFAPHAPRFPYEVWIAPVAHEPTFLTRDEDAVGVAARAARDVLRRYRALFGPHAYNWILHTAPPLETSPALHWRVELFPRLGRVAGFELGTGAYLCEVAPETAAARLRETTP